MGTQSAFATLEENTAQKSEISTDKNMLGVRPALSKNDQTFPNTMDSGAFMMARLALMSVDIIDGINDRVPGSDSAVYQNTPIVVRCVHCGEVTSTRISRLSDFKIKLFQWVLKIPAGRGMKNLIMARWHKCVVCDSILGRCCGDDVAAE